MIKFFFLTFFVATYCTLFSQPVQDTVDQKKVIKIIEYLSSDSLRGRGNYTRELSRAAHYIAAEFKEANLQYFPGYNSYFQPFGTKDLSAKQKQINLSGEYDAANTLLNVVGVLEGKSLPSEVVIFSAHYDHIGINKPEKGDSIFNGANDNASGTAALLSLARYFASKSDNERTIIFCAFAGEEIGLIGSEVFTGNLISGKIKAVINIEMIGRSKAADTNSFFITGAAHSNIKKILRKNLKGYGVRILPEPDESKQLFMRSDNYPFALRGVPAHSIMSGSDNDRCYHKACDEINRIDFNNMIKIIKAIVVGTETIINGRDTPSRINPENLIMSLSNPYRN